MPMQQPTNTTTIRLSLGLLFLSIVVILAIGVIGGYIGSRLTPIPITVLPNGDRTIVPVSQQVTISPSKTGENIVSTQGKSILLLVTQTLKGIVRVGTGVVMTNDGVIATVSDIPDTTPVFALGENGSLATVTHIGTDVLSGITFLKISDQILPPVTLAQSSPEVGAELIALSRGEQTGSPVTSRHTLSAIVAPGNDVAVGVQHVGVLTPPNPPLDASVALFTDEGRLAGVILPADTPTMLLITDIISALSRLSANTLAENPFASRGFTVSWKFTPDATGVFGMRATIREVIPKTQASDVGLKVGDVLISAHGNPITWDSFLPSAIAKSPLILSILRQTEERTLSFP